MKIHFPIALRFAFTLLALLRFVPPAAAAGAPPTANPVVIAVRTPDPGWYIEIQRVDETADAVRVFAQLTRRRGVYPQQIHVASAPVPVALPAKHMQVYIGGKTWTWRNAEIYTFVPSLAAVRGAVAPLRVLYDRSRSAAPPRAGASHLAP